MPAVTGLLRSTRYTHLHVDWFTLDEWLGTGAFVGLERRDRLSAFLAAGADPLPAAWIRGMAMATDLDVASALRLLMDPVTARLRADGARELAAMTIHDWPAAVLPALGFEIVTEVVTMVQVDDRLPHLAAVPNLTLRQAREEDMPALARIEAAAFAPIWRYSAAGLRRALSQCLTFDVAVIDGELVGFQCSTASRRGAHLARMTVAPAFQARGVGSALLARALDDYRRQRLLDVSLNTQIDNIVSQRLYARFGFRLTEERVPVWVLRL
jgi:ribosomal protein S18 acetylase RimI-like enzyme